MSCLRLLFLTPQLPYPPHQGPTKGTTIRNYGLLAGLASRHEIHLATFLAPGDDLADLGLLRDVCEAIHPVPQPQRTKRQRVWTTLTSALPDMAHRLASPVFADTLTRLLADHQFDVVQLEGIEMAPYLSALLDHARQARQPPLLVFDEHNAEYVLQRRVFETDVRVPFRWPGALYSFVQWQKLRRFEAWACRQVDAVAAVSDVDARALQRIVPDLKVSVVPNGIDVAAYSFNCQVVEPCSSAHSGLYGHYGLSAQCGCRALVCRSGLSSDSRASTRRPFLHCRTPAASSA